MDRYKVTWISHNIQQTTTINANSVAEAKQKVKSGRPNGEFKNLTASKLAASTGEKSKYQVTWTSHNNKQTATVSATTAAEAKMKVKGSRPSGEFKGMAAVKMK